MSRVFANIKLFLFCILIIQIFSLLSCSDSIPEISETSVSIVLDYKKENALPDVRLSVFVLPVSEVGRVSYIDVEHIVTGLSWKIEDPIILTANKKYRAGSPFLMPPYNGNIPKGAYKVNYTDLSSRSTESEFNLSYKDDFLSMTPSEVKKYASNANISEQIAIYSEKNGQGVLLYYGEPKEGWSARKKIIEDYNKAMSIRSVYEFQGQVVLCAMPPENIR